MKQFWCAVDEIALLLQLRAIPKSHSDRLREMVAILAEEQEPAPYPANVVPIQSRQG